MEGIVIRALSGFIDVDTGDAGLGILRCRLRGRLKRERQRSDLVVIGDRVEVTPGDAGEGVVEAVLPRRTVFSRRKPGPGGRFKEDVLVANLDQAFAVFAYGKPPFHPRMLDRFLVVAEHNGVEAVVVANKVDLAEPAPAEDPFAPYERIGYRVLRTSARGGVGIEALRAALHGRVSALTGPSGVGKSSLINRAVPGLSLRVGATSLAHDKGRHTTRVAELHPLPGGGFVADTPGIREIGAYRIPSATLDRCFRDIAPHVERCAFADCAHRAEPECAVREAVEEGLVTRARYESYLRLRGEQEAAEAAEHG